MNEILGRVIDRDKGDEGRENKIPRDIREIRDRLDTDEQKSEWGTDIIIYL